jgi:hypothetical protein
MNASNAMFDEASCFDKRLVYCRRAFSNMVKLADTSELSHARLRGDMDKSNNIIIDIKGRVQDGIF